MRFGGARPTWSALLQLLLGADVGRPAALAFSAVRRSRVQTRVAPANESVWFNSDKHNTRGTTRTPFNREVSK